jgi:hypothetical protein
MVTGMTKSQAGRRGGLACQRKYSKKKLRKRQVLGGWTTSHYPLKQRKKWGAWGGHCRWHLQQRQTAKKKCIWCERRIQKMSGAQMRLQRQHPLQVTLLDLIELEKNISWLDGLESWKRFHEDLKIKILVCTECLQNHKERKNNA